MIKLWVLMTGAVATMVFALAVLVIVPKAMLAPLGAPEGLKPYSAAARAGRQVYIANGCLYCHSQQVRDNAFTSDEARGWGRPSVPEDYVHDAPHLLGTSRTGPDLFNVGSRLPASAWHLLHLYQPRALVPWSGMPAFPYLFDAKASASPGETVVEIPPQFASPREVVVARQEALDLVAYLLALRHDYPAPPLQRGAHGH